MAERIVETPLTGREIKEILKADYAAALERSGIGESETYDNFGHTLTDKLWMKNRSGFGGKETVAWASSGESADTESKQEIILEKRDSGTPTEERSSHDMEVTLEHTTTRKRRQGKVKRVVDEEPEEERP